MAERKWIQRAIKRPGALRATAKRLGLIKGDEKLSKTDLEKLESHAKRADNDTLLRQVRLARLFRKFRRK